MAESTDARLSDLMIQCESDKENLVKEFKQVFKEKGADDLRSQVKYLAALGDYYHQRGADNCDWVCLLKAHTLYNSAAARAKENREKLSKKAFEVQLTYWKEKIHLTYGQQREITDCVRRKLTEVRANTKSELDHIEANYTNLDTDTDQLVSEDNEKLCTAFVERVEMLSKGCTDSMVEIFHWIVSKAVDITGDPPSKFCAAALGSIARGEATPYSDLEFLFLLESKPPGAVNYFEDLAMTVYFIIGNLQETKLKYMAIEELSGWFVDTSTNGLKIDGLQKKAGNIPTGNGSCEQRNHFICTVDQLASRYEEVYTNPDPEELVTGDLTDMLYCTVPIYGTTGLLDSFKTRIQKAMPSVARQEASRNMLLKDADTYDFYPDACGTMNKRLNLKHDIYRYTSLLALNLKILHSVDDNSTALSTELKVRGILSSSSFEHLRRAYFPALYMRLSTYLYHGSQNESISVLSPNPDFLVTRDQWRVYRSLLIHMTIHLTPLKDAVKRGQLQNDIAISTADVNKSVAIVGYYTEDYRTCSHALEDIHPDKRDLRTLFLMAHCYLELGRYVEAEKLYSEILGTFLRANPADLSAISACYSGVGVVCREMGRYEEAEKCFIESLEMRQKLYCSSDNLHISNLYNHLGLVHTDLGDYKRAEMYLTKSLEMGQRLFADSDHPSISDSYSNLGFVYICQGEYKKADMCCTKSLELKQRLFNYSDHADISTSYNNLGVVYEDLSDYSRAEMCYNKSLEMNQRLYGDRDHPRISNSYNNLGNVYKNIGDYKRAEIYYAKSLEMSQRLYGDRDHRHISNSYNNLGFVYNNMGDYNNAEMYYNKSLEMNRRLYGDRDHPQISQSYNNLGVVYKTLGDNDRSEMYYTKSLEMNQRLYGDRDHPQISNSYNNLGNMYKNMGDYKRAEIYHTKSLEMSQRLYGDRDHRHISNSYNNLGLVYGNMGDYNRAEMFFMKSLEMRRRLYDNSDHLNIAKSYNNLAVVLAAQGQSEKADLYQAKASDMKERLILVT